MKDTFWMQQALALARHAESCNEVPVGAVVVYHHQIIGRGWNQPITSKDPTAHAEVIALREAARNLNNYRLIDACLYVTLEPCLMCVGSMLHARIKRLVFGANDLKSGAIESVFNILASKQLNHRLIYRGGVLSLECGKLLSDFFAKRR